MVTRRRGPGSWPRANANAAQNSDDKQINKSNLEMSVYVCKYVNVFVCHVSARRVSLPVVSIQGRGLSAAYRDRVGSRGRDVYLLNNFRGALLKDATSFCSIKLVVAFVVLVFIGFRWLFISENICFDDNICINKRIDLISLLSQERKKCNVL